ncbi:P-loop containing nucleoside triphosphate hydrolase protein, partial [Mycena latifolia]
MLGRLRMSIADSILAYEKLQPEPKSGCAEQFKASQLEVALRQIFGEEKMKDGSPHVCKTFVCAMHESNLNASIPELFRSYDTQEEPALDCTIWEAARATSATPGLFKPIEIGRGGVRPKYISGSVGNNNPTSLVVAEAQQMYPSQPIILVVSVGSGHPDTIQIPRSPNLTAMAKTLKSIATDCERIHEDNARRFHGNTYFRFNVLQGLQGFEDQHWGRSSEVSAHTRVYLSTEDVKVKLRGVVDVILNPVVPVSDSPAYLKVCPAPTVHFTGREDILQEMTQDFNTGIGRRHIFLLHGLGGSGKSQIAFKFVEESTSLPVSRFSDIYFVDSSSQQTIENDLVTVALAKKAGKTFQDGLNWLSHQHQEWLMVFNNADDIHLKLVQYFPSGSHGNILITSRNPNLGHVAKAVHKVEQMALEEATDLLLSAARYDVTEDNNRDLGKRIVQKLHCFPLAVAQAGAFISSSRSLQKYLNLYESTRSRIQLLDQQPPQSEYGWSVYTTWQISFQKISRPARELLQLCSFIHHDGITEELFRQAASYEITPNGPTEADLQE